jgi:hypothetical protein
MLAVGTIVALAATARADPNPVQCSLPATAAADCQLTLAVNTVFNFYASVIGNGGFVRFEDGTVTCSGQLITDIAAFNVSAAATASDSSTLVWAIGQAPAQYRSAGVVCTLSIEAVNQESQAVTAELTAEAGNPSTTSASPTPTPSPSPSPSPSASSSASPPASASASSVHLVRGFDGMCVRDMGNSTEPRTKVVIWACDPTAQGQGWAYRDDELRIHGGMCVNAKGKGTSGSPVLLWPCDGGPNEIWTHRSDGEYALKAGGYKMCLTDPRFATANGTQIVVRACADARDQRWSLP